MSALHDPRAHVPVRGEAPATAVCDGDAGPLIHFDRAYRRLAT